MIGQYWPLPKPVGNWVGISATNKGTWDHLEEHCKQKDTQTCCISKIIILIIVCPYCYWLCSQVSSSRTECGIFASPVPPNGHLCIITWTQPPHSFWFHACNLLYQKCLLQSPWYHWAATIACTVQLLLGGHYHHNPCNTSHKIIQQRWRTMIKSPPEWWRKFHENLATLWSTMITRARFFKGQSS